MTTHIVFHKVDYDGFLSAAIAAAVCRYKDEAYQLIPYNYGDEWSIDKYQIAETDTVIMVDCSLQPFNHLIELHNHLKGNVILLDHHKTAIDDVVKSNLTFKGAQVIGKAGCELTWDYFKQELFPRREKSLAVYLCGRYDVKDWRDKRWETDILPFQLGIRTLHPVDYTKFGWEEDLWEELVIADPITITKVVETGRTIERYQKDQDRIFMEASVVALITTPQGMFRALMCNSARKGSPFFASKWDPMKHDIMIPYSYNVDKNTGETKIGMSIYTGHDHISCGAIAQNWGGGGHDGAAGCVVKSLDFIASPEGLRCVVTKL